MAKIVIDGVTYEVNPGNNLLQESLSQGCLTSAGTRVWDR
jgi:NADH dehydrogenase/NADH:ubiquinone oxidoreductase subunit G